MNPVVVCLIMALAALRASADVIEVQAPPKKASSIETGVLVARLSGREAAARRKAFKTVAAEYDLRAFPNAVLAPLRAGLSDRDPAVRRDAAFALAGLASKVSVSTAAVDFSSDPSLRPALLAGLASPDAKVRTYIPLVLGLAYPAAPDIEAALAARFSVEAATAARRNVVAVVGRVGYSSPESLAMLKAAASDPDHVVRTRARRALGRVAPKR